MLTHLKHLANPLRRTGGYALPHIILIVLAVGIAYVLGIFTGVKYTEAYYREHYTFPGLVVTHLPTEPMTARAESGPDQASVTTADLPNTLDQGPEGSCAGHGAAEALTYAYRVLHPKSHLTFSPRQLYDYYSDTYDNGQDGGSWPDQDLEIVSQVGALQFKAYPEGYAWTAGGQTNPAYGVLDPIPATDAWQHPAAQDEAKHHLFPIIHDIGGLAIGQGQGLVDGIESAIASGNPVMFGTYVWSGTDNGTSQPLITSPSPAELAQEPYGRGGHELLAIAYNRTLRFPDGSVGGIEFRNSWGSSYGINGDAWYSDDYVSKYVFGAEYLTLGSAPLATPKPHPVTGSLKGYVPPNTPAHNIVPKDWKPPVKAPSATPWYVHGVVTHDTGIDLTNLINQEGDAWGVSPVGITSVLATESSINQYADRYGTWPDVSHGIAQFTDETAEGYGVCSDDASCRAWLDNPYNAVPLAARFLHELSVETGGVPFPWLYVAYNAGAGWPQSFFYNPTGEAAANFQGFLRNYNYVMDVYGGGSPPPPPPPPPTPKPTPKPHKPFSVKAWQYWTKAHHRPSVPHRWHGKLARVAGVWWFGNHVAACGSPVQREQWNPHNHVMHQRFARCSFWSWPRGRGDPVKIKRLVKREWM